MQLEQGRISSSQLVILATGFLMGSSFILNPGQEAMNNAWLAVITGTLEALVFVLAFTSLCGMYPRKTIVEINDIVLGPYIGKFFSICYLWFFFHIGAMVLRNFGGFFSTLMPTTPMAVFIIVALLVCAATVQQGIEGITRVSQILVPVTIITFIITTALVSNQMDLSNFLPFMDISIQKFIQASHTTASFPFGEIIAFIMILPFLNKSEHSRKSMIYALLISSSIYLIAVIRNTAVLGDFAAISFFPALSVIRLIDLAAIITRIDIIIATSFLVMGYIYVSVVYYGTVLGIAQLFKLSTFRPLILPIGFLMFIMSIIQFENCMENISFASNIYPYYSLPFEFLLPLITLFIAKVRNLKIKRYKNY